MFTIKLVTFVVNKEMIPQSHRHESISCETYLVQRELSDYFVCADKGKGGTVIEVKQPDPVEMINSINEHGYCEFEVMFIENAAGKTIDKIGNKDFVISNLKAKANMLDDLEGGAWK